MWATGGNQSVGSLGRFILETYISFRALHTHNFPAARPADAAVQLPFGWGWMKTNEKSTEITSTNRNCLGKHFLT